uniref:N-acetyltransferase domain-containing protein n=1 Tax=Caenorhabditis tropicalis TaxID=1561998 RepID=A0A1I7UX17_9PELO
MNKNRTVGILKKSQTFCLREPPTTHSYTSVEAALVIRMRERVCETIVGRGRIEEFIQRRHPTKNMFWLAWEAKYPVGCISIVQSDL